MKNLLLSLFVKAKVLFAFLFFLTTLGAYSQTCEVTLRNDSLIDANNLIVDIYLKATSVPFYYSSGQFKVTYNKTSLLNSGSISGSIVPGYSDLTNSSQIPTNVNTLASTSWRVTAESNPNTQAACSQISSSGNGTRICRVQLTNTASFGAYTADNLLVTTNPNVTAIWYADVDGTALPATITLVNSNLVNPILNGTLTVFTVTGGGTAPAAVGLDGSQTGGVNYILYNGTNPQGSAVNGTGSAISFGNQPEGTYTVKAHRKATYMYKDMQGTAIVNAACVPVSVGIQPSPNNMCAGTGNASFTTTANGSAPFIYQWQYNNGGTWETVNNGTSSGASYVNATTATLNVSGITTPGSYQYRCFINNCSGANNATSSAATLTVNPIPTVPAATAGSGATCSQITANWASSTNALSYRLDVSTSSTFASFVSGYQDRNVLNVTNYTVTGLTGGTTYYYRVRAVNDCGTSSSSSTITYATTPATPAAPVATAGSGATCSQITANWAASTNALSYRLDVSTSNTFVSYVAGYQDLNVLNVTSYIVTGLTGGTTYYYRVRAVNDCGTSSNSGIITYATAAGTPSQPGTITGTATQCPVLTNQTYSISAVANATTYTWIVPTGWAITAGAGTTSITTTTGSSGQGGNISVTAGNSCGISAARTLAVTVSPGTPATPGTISGTAAQCPGLTGQVYIIGAVTNATTYTWTVPTGWAITAGQGTTSITATAGSAGQGGNITVTAGNSCGTSIASTLAVTVNSLSTAPAGVAITNNNTCNGISKILTVTGGSLGSGANWQWYTGTCGGTLVGTGLSIIVDPAAGTSTTYYVRASGACNTTACANGTAVVNPAVGTPVTPTPSATTICQGSTNTTYTSSAINATSYNWSVTGTGNTISGIGTTGTVTWSPGFYGTATVSVTSNGCNGPSSPAFTSVTVTSNPSAPTGSTSQAFCSSSLPTVASITATGTGIKWYLGPTDGIALSTSTALATGTYYASQTVSGCESTSRLAVSVTVNTTPAAPTVGTITQPTCISSTGSVVLSGLPSGNWTINPGSITGNTAGTTVNNLLPGTYNFTVTTNPANCTSVATSNVVINAQSATPTPPIVVTITQPTCTLATGGVVLSGLPSSGTWTLTRYSGTVTTSGTGTSVSISELPSGSVVISYNYTVTNAAGCTSLPSTNVDINPQPPIPVAPVQSVDCSLGYGRAVVTVTSPTGSGYQYRLDMGTFQSSTSFTGVANDNHTITVQNSSGCTTTGTSFSVSCGCANPPAVALSSTSGSTCGVTPVTVTDNTFSGGATSVAITENGSGSVNPSSANTSLFNFTYTPVAADAGKVVTITVTTNNPFGTPCTAATATYTLTVNAIPSAPALGTITQPTCSEATGSVVLNGLPSTGIWTLTRTPGGTTTTGTGTSITISGLAESTTYTVTVTSVANCISPASANVVINPQPATPTPPVVGTITYPTCGLSTGSVVLSGLPTGNWTLNRNPGGVTINGNVTSRTVSGLLAGTYTFTVTNASTCTSVASDDVIINAQPQTPSAPLVGTILPPTCTVSTGSVTLNGLPLGTWTVTRYPGTVTLSGEGTSTTVAGLTAGSTSNYTVTNSSGCTSLPSSNVVISAQPATPSAPVIGTITHPTFAVPSGSVVLSGLPASGTWTLTRNPDGVITTGTGTSRTINGMAPGIYTFTVANAVGCTSVSSVNVVINAIPGTPVVVIKDPAPVCSTTTADLTAPAVTAGSADNLTFTYWTDAAATIPYTTPSAATAGTYYMKGTTTAGYFTIKPVTVTVFQLPEPNAGPDRELEYLFVTDMEATPLNINETGTWSIIKGSGAFTDTHNPETTVSGLALGENIILWRVNNGVCPNADDYVTITVNDLVIPTLITPNGDAYNEYFVLRGIETLGKTELTIFDRRGAQVYKNMNYDNSWNGLDDNGNTLPDDTYFYVMKSQNGKSMSGYIVIRR